MDNTYKEELISLEIGTTVKGTVTEVSKLYSILKVDTINCILPTSEMTWNKKPRCNVKKNDEVECVVVKVEDGQVMVSTKRLLNNPWNNINTRYTIGDQLKVTVVNITDIGVFVELEPGLRGLIHKTKLSFDIVNNPNDYATVGQVFDAEIIEINTKRQRLELSRLPFLVDPWDDIEKRYSVGQVITGIIKIIQDYGVFLELEPGLNALYHRSKMNIPKGSKLKEIFNVEDSLTLEINSIDAENRRLSLKTHVKE